MQAQRPESMRDIRFENERTADMAGLGAFPKAFDLIPNFFVSLLETLTILISFAFTFNVERDFFACLDSGSSSEPSRSLASVSVFLRLLDFAPASGSGRPFRFFGGGGDGSSAFSAWSLIQEVSFGYLGSNGPGVAGE